MRCSGKKEAAPKPARHCSAEVLGFAELKQRETRYSQGAQVGTSEETQSGESEGTRREEGGRRILQDLPTGWVGLYKQREPLQLPWLLTGNKAVFQEKAAVPRALEAKGYLELIMGKTG